MSFQFSLTGASLGAHGPCPGAQIRGRTGPGSRFQDHGDAPRPQPRRSPYRTCCEAPARRGERKNRGRNGGRRRKKERHEEKKGGGQRKSPPALRHSPVPRADDADAERRHPAGCVCPRGSARRARSLPSASTAPAARPGPRRCGRGGRERAAASGQRPILPGPACGPGGCSARVGPCAEGCPASVGGEGGIQYPGRGNGENGAFSEMYGAKDLRGES